MVTQRRCFLAAILLFFAGNAPAQEAMFDLVIRGGKIVDGTGNPWFVGDVAIRGDKIAVVGSVPAKSGKREIDARGLVVSPGFIDIHSHSDYLLLEDGNAPSKVRQGVTTEVLGEGSSVAPNRGPLTPKVTGDGPQPRFSRLADYFDKIDRSGVAVNVASYVGMDNIWQSVMGHSFDRPTAEQFAKMREITDEAMRDGASGMSSLLAMPPGSLTTTDDIIELCKMVAKHRGIFSTHNRNEGTGILEAVREAITVGEKAGLPVDIIHLKIADQKLWGKMNEVVALIDAARRRGVNVQANVYPYTRGNNNLASIIPPWAHEGGTPKMLARLKETEQREKLKKDIRDGLPGWYNHYTAVGGDWSRMLVSGKGPYEGLTMDRVMAAKSKDKTPTPDPLDLLFDLLFEQGGSVPTVYEHHTQKDMILALSQPWCSVGSDGAAYAIEGTLRRGNPHPRNFGTFPRVLGVYVRENGLLKLEDAIRKMTSLNASKIGIMNRGLLRPDLFADITIFDPKTVTDKSTYESPFHYNEGIEYVLVNGKLTLDQGKPTGVKPGRALRHGKE